MLIIRTFEPKDTIHVTNLIIPIQQEEFGVPITLEGQPDLKSISTFYQHGTGNFWIAENNGAIVGTIALLDIGDKQAALRKMFVGAEYRGSSYGVASKLLSTLKTWARAKGITQVYLGTTAQFLAAHRFYEKNGFNEVAKSSLPASFPIIPVDTKFYMLSLDASEA